MLASLLLAFVQSPDLVVFVLDDIGQTDIDLVDTPAIDALSRRGTTFTMGIGQPWCTPARHSFLLSDWQGTGHGRCCEDPEGRTITASSPNLARDLSSNGYQTALFGKWHMGTYPEATPGTQEWKATPLEWGFDEWLEGIPDNVEHCIPTLGGYTNWRRVDGGAVSISTEHHTLALRDAFLDWWAATPSPKAAVVCFQAAHQANDTVPWPAPPAELLPPGYQIPVSPSPRDLFEATVASASVAVGQMLDVVDYRETVVVLFADNGTPQSVPGPNQTGLSVKHTCAQGGIRVPFVIAAPGFRGKRLCPSPVSVVDLRPTIGDLLSYVPSGSMDGQSLVPALDGRAVLPRRWVFAQRDQSDDYAVIEYQWKLRENDGVESLYDLIRDPFEANPIDPDSAGYERIAARLRAAMAEARQ